MSSISVRLAAVGAWLPFLVVAGLAGLPGSGTHFYSATWYPVYLVAFGLAGAGALAAGVKVSFAPSVTWRDPRAVFGVGALLLWLLTWNRSLVASPWPDRAWLDALVPLGATGVGLLAARSLALARDPVAVLRPALWTVTVVGLLLGARSLLLWIGETGGAHLALQNRLVELLGASAPDLGSMLQLANPHPFGHANYTGAMGVLLLPPALALALTEKGLRRLPGLLAAVVLVAVILTSDSRAGILALAGTAGLAAILAVGRLPLPRLARGVLVVLALAVAAGGALTSPQVRTTAARVLSGDVRLGLDPGRSELVRVGAAMGAARPFSGWGAGTTPLVYTSFRSDLGSPGLAHAHQLHSTPVQLWADHGLLGPFSFALVVLAAALGWGRGRRALSSAGRTLVDGAALGAVGALGFGLTDYALDVPFHAAGLALLLGLAAGTGFHRRALAPPPAPAPVVEAGRQVLRLAEEEEKVEQKGAVAAPARASGSPPPAARLLRLVGLLTSLWLVCFGLLAGLRQTLVAITRPLAYTAATDGALELGERMALWDRAIAGAPTEPAHRLGRASLLTEAALSASDEYQPTLRAAAAEAWDAALQVWPESEWAHYQAGWLRVEDDPAVAEAHFRAAARLIPEKTGVHYGLALTRRAAGDFEGLFSALALELYSNPAFGLVPVWRDPANAMMRAAVEERLAALHAAAKAVERAGSLEARQRALGYALLRWWWTGITGPDDRAAIAAGPRTEHRWLADALAPGAPSVAPPIPTLALAWQAWRRNIPAGGAAAGTILLVRGTEPDPLLAGTLAAWLTQPDFDFASLLRSAPIGTRLVVPWRASRPAQPLLDRQVSRPVPLDVLDLEQEVPALLWIRPLFPNSTRPPADLHDEWLNAIGQGEEGRRED